MSSSDRMAVPRTNSIEVEVVARAETGAGRTERECWQPDSRTSTSDPDQFVLERLSLVVEATLSFWSVFIRSSVVMANELSSSGSRQGEDSLGALKEPPRLRK